MTAKYNVYRKIKGSAISPLNKTTRTQMGYGGSKGYNNKYGRYVGSIAIMMDYLKIQNYTKWLKFDSLLKFRGRKSVSNLSEQELEDLRRDIWLCLKPETQRKFMTMGFIHR